MSLDYIYHVGFLARDREPAENETRAEAEVRENLSDKADKLWRAAMDGKVTLYQRRVGPMKWEYHARAVKGA